jgi:murein DD-endopeptidase MepM/ murein hydrolase activator NlpD
MERTLSQDERQRRAEELYYRRKNAVNEIKATTVNVNPKKNFRLLKKVFIQIIVCALIYGAIYKLQGNTDSFSIDSINYLKNAIAYDIDMNRTFENLKKYMGIFNIEKPENTININNVIEEDKSNEEAIVDNTLKEATLAASEQIEDNKEEQELVSEEASSVSQMDEDATYIKNNISFIKPLEGPVTSRFGLRNPTTATVPKYHTGIDIGVPEGTVIVSAMEGTVELVSSVGDYGKHIKITNGEVMTLYAHCETIYVKEGDKISQGQQIAETGSTGNVTGPHLHFEIRRNNEYVDPDLILDF